MALLCQPAELQPPVPLPADLACGASTRESVTRSAAPTTASVRAGAFMGLRILADHLRVPGGTTSPNVDAGGFRARRLPSARGDERRRISRALRRHVRYGHDGAAGPAVLASAPRPPTRSTSADGPRQFRQLLRRTRAEDSSGVRLGTLMYESHASYGRCGLGSRGTDRLVELVQSAGPDAGLYGARITGGGSGGTVAIIGRPDASPAIAAATI